MNLELCLGRSPSGTKVWLKEPPNPHVYISGQSGSGKSSFLKQLVWQALEQDALCLVLDSSSDFRSCTPPDGVSFRCVDVMGPAFTLNPLARAGQDSVACAQHLLGLLEQVCRMGPRAALELLQVTQSYLKVESGVPSLVGLSQYVYSLSSQKPVSETVADSVELVAYLVRCGDQPISVDLTSPGLLVLDLSQVLSQKLRAILIEMILQTVWTQRCSGSLAPSVPLIVVLDECQGLCWGENGMAIRILREGRKFDMAGWFCSQWLSKGPAVSALHQAALQAHFRPDDCGITRLARMLCPGDRTEVSKYRRLLQSLRVGQFLWQRQGHVPVLVSVPPRLDPKSVNMNNFFHTRENIG